MVTVAALIAVAIPGLVEAPLKLLVLGLQALLTLLVTLQALLHSLFPAIAMVAVSLLAVTMPVLGRVVLLWVHVPSPLPTTSISAAPTREPTTGVYPSSANCTPASDGSPTRRHRGHARRHAQELAVQRRS